MLVCFVVPKSAGPIKQVFSAGSWHVVRDYDSHGYSSWRFICECVILHLNASCHVYTRRALYKECCCFVTYCPYIQLRLVWFVTCRMGVCCAALKWVMSHVMRRAWCRVCRCFVRCLSCIQLTVSSWFSSWHHTVKHWNTLQHPVTLCNTLQHTVIHCNTLQHTHTVTLCDTLQHTVTHCNTMVCFDVSICLRAYRVLLTSRCNTLQNTATHCNTLQHTATHCNTPQHTDGWISGSNGIVCVKRDA